VTLFLGLLVVIAANFSFTGSFANDNDVQFFNFSVGAPSTIILETFSYAGGTNAAGTVIPAGGFDPNLSVFDTTGLLIGVNGDGAGVPVDPVTGNAFDALLQFISTLSPGTYRVALTQYDNSANGPTLADGFHEDGNPIFTGAMFGCGDGILFCDASPAIRTNQWALDILNVASADEVGAATPLPAALPLFATGLGALGLLGWRRIRKNTTAVA
jgi:hypothetical protein